MLTDTGLYKLSITLVDTFSVKYINRPYQFNIRYPQAITAYSELESQERVLKLNLSGASNYNVFVNGQLFTTESSIIKLPLQTGVNTVVIKSDLPCQDSIIKTILVSESVTLYPNPVKDYLNINVGGEDKELSVEIFDNVGKLVFSKNGTLDQGRNIIIDMRQLKSGVYYVKLKGNFVFGTYSLLKSE